MAITAENLSGYSTKALKRMFGEDTPPEVVPEAKPSAMKYTKEFFLGTKPKKAKKSTLKKKKPKKRSKR